jgi:hypothetical protein
MAQQVKNEDENPVKKEKIINCKFNDKWMNPISKKFIYYHDVITDKGSLLSIGTMEKNSARIETGVTIEYMVDEKGKVKIISSSNDAGKSKPQTKQEKSETKSTPATSSRIKGQEAFLGYAWSYAKDLVIAGKTSEDLQELNKIARFIYNEIGKMLSEEKK